jgi:hypothetical protein
MKPRIYLKHAWNDSGWRYEQWCCKGIYAGKACIGLGKGPREAYMDWMTQGVCK